MTKSSLQIHVADTADTSSPEAMYASRCVEFAAERDRTAVLSRRLANINLSLVAAALICIGLAVWFRTAVWLAVGLGLGLGFIASYVYHGVIDRRQQRAETLRAINDEGLKRLHRDWDGLPLRQSATPAPDDSYARDLDLLGRASLIHLLGTANTPAGQGTLQGWLLEPAAHDVVTERQAAVRELARMIAFRDELAFRGRGMANAQPHYEAFVRWAEGEPWLVHHSWLVWLSRISPVLVLLTAVAQATGLITYALWLPLVALNLGLVLTVGRRVDAILDQVSARQRVFRTYAELFQLVADQSFNAPALRNIQRALSADSHRADEQMQRLGRIMALADFRMFMFYLPIQLVTLWNVHVLWLLERWQVRVGRQVGTWLEALGDLEALSALGTLAFDHPDWVFPELDVAGPPVVTAHGLGHPLLPPAACVRNDISVGPPGSFVLVTGSNMSGKSTLLRSLGVNIVLAQAGAPVCATRLHLPPLVLATSMRVEDSLEQGVSYFMAEIRRLKLVVDRAQATRLAGERTLLFLLDEILHGTNTTERQIAARQVIRHLVEQGAIGAVSTHDLALAEAPELASAAQLVHFTETYTRDATGPTLTFDYRLRPGIATSTNALKLMEIVGLPVDEPVERPAPV